MRRRAPRWRWRRSSRRTGCRPAASRPRGSRGCASGWSAPATSSRLGSTGVKPERAPVLPGGFAIMAAAMAELDVPRINPVGGALRLGVLYDLLGRTVQRDSRAATVERFSSAITSTARTRSASRRWRRRSTSRPPRARRRSRAAAASGRRCCTRSATRCRTSATTSTARTSWRTPTCRAFRRRSSGNSRCWCRVPRRPVEDEPALAVPDVARAIAGAAARGAVPSCAPCDRPAAHRLLKVAGTIRFACRQAWLKAIR